MTDYTLTRADRKTISIKIADDGSVLVTVPCRLSDQQIKQFVAKKAGWITKTRQRVLDAVARQAEFDPLRSGSLWLLGNRYPIRQGEETAFDGVCFIVKSVSFFDEKPELISLYRRLAAELIRNRVEEYAPRVGVQPSGVKITSPKTRWGSCSGNDRLCFNWKLVFAPLAAVDYVVVHELCHIRHHNHAPRFWAAVAEVLPDYKKREKILQELQQRLNEENWEVSPE